MQAKLDLPWRKHVGSNLSGSSATDQGVGGAIILNIESVEEFRPKGNEKCFADREILEYREIRVIHGSCPQDVSSEIPIGERWYREGARVEPLVYRPMGRVWISYDVRPGVVPKRSVVPDVGYVASYCQVIGLTGTQLHYPGYLPISENLIGDTTTI